MPPSTTSASDRRSASQALTAASEALTAATANLRHAERLVRIHSQVTQELKNPAFTIQTKGILNNLNQSVMSRLRQNITDRHSLFTAAAKAYTNATGLTPDDSILSQPEPNHVPTPAESKDLLSELQTAQEIFLEAGTVEDDDILESIYLAYEKVLAIDKFKPKSRTFS